MRNFFHASPFIDKNKMFGYRGGDKVRGDLWAI
jgi:hypothetical protein